MQPPRCMSAFPSNLLSQCWLHLRPEHIYIYQPSKTMDNGIAVSALVNMYSGYLFAYNFWSDTPQTFAYGVSRCIILKFYITSARYNRETLVVFDDLA